MIRIKSVGVSDRFRLGMLALLAVHCVLLAFSGWHQSPTLNEPGHLVAGLRHWKTGDFSLYRVNPPLIRLVAAIPATLIGYEADWSEHYEYIGARPVFDLADTFVELNGRQSMLYFRLGRWALIPFSLLGAWICYAWARELFSDLAGLIACSLWCFSPMVLGHASMITADAHATSLGLAACYTFWKWLKEPTWRQAMLTGIVLGLAELSKTTMILFYPLWPLLWIAYRWRERHEMTLGRWRDEAGMLVLRMAIGIYVLNLGYLGQGSFTQLKDFHFVSKMFCAENVSSGVYSNRFSGSWLGEVPVPFPRNYVLGIDTQQRDFEDFSRPSYLRGEYQRTGWWYYYAYAILVKSPLGTLGLSLLTFVTSVFRFGATIAWRDTIFLLAPAVVIFVIASMKYGFSHHSRYILPCVPFVLIWISGMAAHICTFATTALTLWHRPKAVLSVNWRRGVSSILGLTTVCLLGWSIVFSLAVYPHSLSCFNELVGGPKRGPEHLLNSNIDWGQDLLFLEKWIQHRDKNEQLPVYLAFYNSYNPFAFEIDRIEPWPFRGSGSDGVHVPEGFYAISVNPLYDFPTSVFNRDGTSFSIGKRPMAHLRKQQPLGWAGYSIRIFSSDQLREAYASP